MILVMKKDGKIVEQGRHESLLKQNGFYRRLFMKASLCLKNESAGN